MTEQEKADTGKAAWHPLVRMVFENPISVFNAVAIIFGGGMVYSKVEDRMEQIDQRFLRIEAAVARETVIASAKDSITTQKFEQIQQRLSDVAVTTARTDEAVRYIAEQLRQQQQQRRGAQ